MIDSGEVLMNADSGQETRLSTTIDLPTVEDVKARFDQLSALHAGVINAPAYVRAHFHENFRRAISLRIVGSADSSSAAAFTISSA